MVTVSQRTTIFTSSLSLSLIHTHRLVLPFTVITIILTPVFTLSIPITIVTIFSVSLSLIHIQNNNNNNQLPVTAFTVKLSLAPVAPVAPVTPVTPVTLVTQVTPVTDSLRCHTGLTVNLSLSHFSFSLIPVAIFTVSFSLIPVTKFTNSCTLVFTVSFSLILVSVFRVVIITSILPIFFSNGLDTGLSLNLIYTQILVIDVTDKLVLPFNIFTVHLHIILHFSQISNVVYFYPISSASAIALGITFLIRKFF